MFQLSYFEWEASVLRGQLPSSLSFLKSLVLWWDDWWSWLGNVRYLWIFQVDHIFYKLDVKILTNNNKIRCVSSYPPSSSSASDPFQQKLYIVLAFSKKSSISSGAQVWKSMQFVIFKPWKLLWNRSIKQINYKKLLKFLLFGSV